MLTINGYICGVEYSETTFGPQGVPQPSEKKIGDLIECMYAHVQIDRRGDHRDGSYTRQSYKVHIPKRSMFAYHRARLHALDGSLIGEFTVQSAIVASILNHTEIILD